MRFRVRKSAHVLERIGLAMAGASCGLFVSAHVGSSIGAPTSQGFLLSMMIVGAIAFYLGIDTPQMSFTPMTTPARCRGIPERGRTFLATLTAFFSVGIISSPGAAYRLDLADHGRLGVRHLHADRRRHESEDASHELLARPPRDRNDRDNPRRARAALRQRPDQAADSIRVWIAARLALPSRGMISVATYSSQARNGVTASIHPCHRDLGGRSDGVVPVVALRKPAGSEPDRPVRGGPARSAFSELNWNPETGRAARSAC